GFPYQSRTPEVKKYDPHVAEIDADVLAKATGTLISEFEERDVLLSDGSLSASHSIELLANTSGLFRIEEGTECYANAEGIAEENNGGKQVASAYDLECSRSLDILDSLPGLAERVSTLAKDSLHTTKCERLVGTGVLTPLALLELLSGTFMPAIILDAVLKGRSALAGKLGEEVASPSLSIIDDPLYPMGMGSYSYDGEGVPSEKKAIIDKGVLTTLLSDLQSVARAQDFGMKGIKSTGNCVRGSAFVMPSTDVTNLVFSTDENLELSEVDSGVLISTLVGAHTANPISGDFSLEVKGGYIIKAGEIKGVVEKLMVSGNLYKLLSSLTGSVGEPRMVGSLISPAMAFEGLTFIGE
ncbi:MAG: metallopeptidase TldD-related protein, partial [Methermicoccaceae archaeon]